MGPERRGGHKRGHTLTDEIALTLAPDTTQLPMRCSATIEALTVALAKAQGQFPAIEKDKTARIQTKSGTTYSYSYADLASILAAVRKPLSDNALAIMQPIKVNGRTVSVTTVLAHSSGQWVADELDMPIGDSTDARSLASAVTYARRYGLIALLGIAPAEEDDDGAQATTEKAPVSIAPPWAEKPPAYVETLKQALKAGPVPKSAAFITEPQRRLLFATAADHGWTKEQLKTFLVRGFGIESTTQIPPIKFEEILDHIARESPPGIEHESPF